MTFNSEVLVTRIIHNDNIQTDVLYFKYFTNRIKAKIYFADNELFTKCFNALKSQ